MTRSWLHLAFLFLAFPIFATLWYVLQDEENIVQYQRNYELYATNLTASFNQLPDNDYGQLIDLNFTFNTLNLVCNDSSAPFLLVLVHSSSKNFEKRETIRKTWGQHNDKIKLLFVLGAVNDKELQHKLDLENKKYNDFIQGSFLDTYRNITYKHVMLFKYVVYHCLDAKYILKTDDDVFVNTPLLINFLNNDLSPHGTSKMLFCETRSGHKVKRSYRSKWRVSFEEYSGKEYPTHCPGWFLLYSPDVIFGLYREAQNAPYFWIDDVHVTGTLFQKLKLKHSNIQRYKVTLKDVQTIVKAYGNNDMASINATKKFLHGNLKEEEIKALWNYVETHNVPNSLFDGNEI